MNMIHTGIPSVMVCLSNLTGIALLTMKSTRDLRFSKYSTFKLRSCGCHTISCGKKVPMLQRNLLLPTSGRSSYIASHPEDHKLDFQWCHILKFHTPPSSFTDCKTEKSCWNLFLYNVIQPETYSTMNLETKVYSETQAPIYQTVI